MKTNDLVHLDALDVNCRITATDQKLFRGICVETGQIYWIENVCALGRTEWIATVTSRSAEGRIKTQTMIRKETRRETRNIHCVRC